MPEEMRQSNAIQAEEQITGNYGGAPPGLMDGTGHSESRIAAPAENLAHPISLPCLHRAAAVACSSKNRSIRPNIQFGSSHMMKWRAVSVTSIRTPASLAYCPRRLASVRSRSVYGL